MKHICYPLFAVVIAALMITSCKKENDNNLLDLENPFESIEVNLGTTDLLTVLTQDSTLCKSHNWWIIEDNYSSNKFYRQVSENIKISTMSNFMVEIAPIEDGDYYVEDLEYSIVSVGSVESLSKIDEIPEHGWASQVAVNQGYGYIVKMEGEWYYGYFCRYARVYVNQLINGGVNMQYQPNWKYTYTPKSKMKRFFENAKEQYLKEVI